MNDDTKQNILVKINDFVMTCFALNCAGYEVTVVASGSMWATIPMNFEMRKMLTNKNISWQFDK
jgi:hypothetical protein